MRVDPDRLNGKADLPRKDEGVKQLKTDVEESAKENGDDEGNDLVVADRRSKNANGHECGTEK